MDHVDKAKVRSAVGLTVNAGWFMDVVNAIGDCSDGDPDRATYREAMDHVDKAKVRSAVGLTVNAGWFMDVVNAIGDCSDGDPDRCTYPT